MKIGILTQPLGHNYGGILQNFALQEAIRRKGFMAETINLIGLEKGDLRSASKAAKRCVAINFKRLSRTYIPPEVQYGPLHEFINRHIRLTRPYDKPIRPSDLEELGYDGYIVGSDQVWRASYSPNLLNYFLDFTGDSDVKRIAFAASFGNAQAEYDQRRQMLCTPLISKFDAVSVREKTAVSSCRDMFGISAKLACDPTLLLESTAYRDIIESESSIAVPGSACICYFLNPTREKWEFASRLCAHRKLTPVSLLPKVFAKSQNEETTFSPSRMLRVPDWLACMDNAAVILTDSFHGTVFSLIFRRPFGVFNNHARGSDRIPSLLELAGLRDRIIDASPISAAEDCSWNAPIDWDRVWNVLNAFIRDSHDFLDVAIG